MGGEGQGTPPGSSCEGSCLLSTMSLEPYQVLEQRLGLSTAGNEEEQCCVCFTVVTVVVCVCSHYFQPSIAGRPFSLSFSVQCLSARDVHLYPGLCRIPESFTEHRCFQVGLEVARPFSETSVTQSLLTCLLGCLLTPESRVGPGATT